jgi:hypothetical protein
LNEKEALFEEINGIYSRLPKRYPVFILGDFNGRVGQADGSIVGNHNTESFSNVNGQLLLNFCAAHKLKTAATFFRHRRSNKWTWHCPKGTRKNLCATIDHCIISMIKDCKTSGISKVSDHKALILSVIKSNLNFKKTILAPASNIIWSEETIQDINNLLKTTPICNSPDIENKWSAIKNNAKKTLRYLNEDLKNNTRNKILDSGEHTNSSFENWWKARAHRR